MRSRLWCQRSMLARGIYYRLEAEPTAFELDGRDERVKKATERVFRDHADIMTKLAKR